MSDDTLKIRRKISTLTRSLDDLETSLTALSSQSLPDLVIGLDTIQQAKLQVVIPYLVYDLVFVYLKTRGLDPKTHTVIAELDRVRQYFDKIKDAEDPAKRQLVIDKAAATRFIKNAIAQANDTTRTNASDTGPAPATTTHPHIGDESGNANASDKARDVRFPTKITEKMLDREKYHEALREEAQLASDEDGEGLEIIDNDDGNGEEEKEVGKVNAAVASPTPIPDVPPPTSAAARKRRRPAIDPFAGYGDGPDTPARSSAAPSAETDSAPSTSRSGRKIRRTRKADVSADQALSGGNILSGGEKRQDTVEKKAKKRSKKKAVP
jgi:exosome complex protein LRP1